MGPTLVRLGEIQMWITLFLQTFLHKEIGFEGIVKDWYHQNISDIGSPSSLKELLVFWKNFAATKTLMFEDFAWSHFPHTVEGDEFGLLQLTKATDNHLIVFVIYLSNKLADREISDHKEVQNHWVLSVHLVLGVYLSFKLEIFGADEMNKNKLCGIQCFPPCVVLS